MILLVFFRMDKGERIHTVRGFEIFQFHPDLFVFGSMVHEIPNQFQHIIVDVNRMGSINHHMTVFRQMRQSLFDGGLVQK